MTDEREFYLDDLTLPSLGRPVGKLKCFTEMRLAERDAAIEARVRAEVERDLARQIRTLAEADEALLEDWATTCKAPYPVVTDFTVSVVRGWLHAIASKIDAGSEPAREDYPGQRSTPDGCPVCRGPIEREVAEFVDGDGHLVEEPSGRWLCPKGCNPRAAGSSPDTTPEPASRCGVCGGQLGVQGCVRRCNTTPEPKRRYPRTSELTDQERYEIEEAAAAHRAEVDPDEVDRRDG